MKVHKNTQTIRNLQLTAARRRDAQIPCTGMDAKPLEILFSCAEVVGVSSFRLIEIANQSSLHKSMQQTTDAHLQGIGHAKKLPSLFTRKGEKEAPTRRSAK